MKPVSRYYLARLVYERSFSPKEEDELFRLMAAKYPLHGCSVSYSGMTFTQINETHPTGPHTQIVLTSWSAEDLPRVVASFEYFVDGLASSQAA
jgi:hypothetical protein